MLFLLNTAFIKNNTNNPLNIYKYVSNEMT